jgi:hypothetical protein
VAGAVLAELTASWIIKHIDSGGDPATTVMIQDGKLGYFVGLVCGLLETQRKAEEVMEHPAGHA